MVSAFAAMFTTDPRQVAEELTRVCRPSGRLGLCNWPPESLMGQVLIAAGAPEAAATWGVEKSVRDLFGRRVSTLIVTRRVVLFRYRSATHMRDDLGECDTTVRAALGAREQQAEQRLAAELVEMFSAHNRADDGTLVVSSDYLEIVAEVR